MASLVAADAEDPEQLWREASQAYFKETGRSVDADFMLRNLRSIEELEIAIQHNATKFKKFRGHHGRVWNALKKFLGPISVASKIAQGIVSASGHSWIALITGSVFYLLEQCEAVVEAYDFIEQLFSELSQFTERLEQYMKHEMAPSLKAKIISFLVFFLKVVGRSESLIKSKRFRLYLRSTFTNTDETKELIEELNKRLREEDALVTSLIYSTSKNVELQNSSLMREVVGIKRSLTWKQRQEQAAENEKVLESVLKEGNAYKEVLELYTRTKRELLDGTGSWLLSETLFDSWLNGNDGVIWILGPPGSGKTYLATWLITHLRQQWQPSIQRRQEPSILYFYIREDTVALHDPNTILKTLAYQLSRSDERYRQYIITELDLVDTTITAEDTWEHLFLQYFGSIASVDSQALMVFDGLDEAPLETRNIVYQVANSINILADKLSSESLRLQCAIVGRLDLRSDFDYCGQRIVEVSRNKNKSDLELYVDKRLWSVACLRKLRAVRGPKAVKSFHSIMKQRILQNAEGVFMWAKLIIDQIMGKDAHQIQKYLEHPPQDLDQLIHSIFVRLARDSDIDRDLFKALLTLVLRATQPLTLVQIVSLLKFMGHQVGLFFWTNLRGKFSSLFNLDLPRNYDFSNEETGNANPDVTFDDEVDVSGPLSFDSLSHMSGSAESLAPISIDSLDDGGDEIDVKDGTSWLGLNDAKDYLTDVQGRTSITFAHQRIRDYLNHHTSLKQTEASDPSFYPDVDRVDIDMLMLCFRIFRETPLEWRGTIEMAYAVDNFVRHLQSVSFGLVSADEQKSVTENLVWLFSEHQGCATILQGIQQQFNLIASYEFLQTWFTNNTYSSVVRKWALQQKESSSIAGLDEASQQWIETAINSTKSMLSPWANECRKLWLGPHGSEDEIKLTRDRGFIIRLLDYFWYMNDEGEINPPRTLLLSELNILSDLTSRRIIQLAETSGIEKTSSWYLGLGLTLMMGKYVDEAIFYLEKAGEDPAMQSNRDYALGSCFHDKEDYVKAIKYMESAAPNLEESDRAMANLTLANCKSKLGDRDGAVKALRAGLTYQDTRVEVNSMLLGILESVGETDILVEVLQDLNTRYTQGSRLSCLSQIFNDGNDLIYRGVHLRVIGQPHFFLESIDEAILFGQRTKDSSSYVRLQYRAGSLRLQFYDQSYEAIGYLQQASKGLNAPFADDLTEGVYHIITLLLPQLYFDAAVRDHEAGKSKVQSKWIEKVTNPVLPKGIYNDQYEMYELIYPDALKARWLRNFDKADEGVWRKPLKKLMTALLEEMLDGSLDRYHTTHIVILAHMYLHIGEFDRAKQFFALWLRSFHPGKERNLGLRKVPKFEDHIHPSPFLYIDRSVVEPIDEDDEVDQESSGVMAENNDQASESKNTRGDITNHGASANDTEGDTKALEPNATNNSQAPETTSAQIGKMHTQTAESVSPPPAFNPADTKSPDPIIGEPNLTNSLPDSSNSTVTIGIRWNWTQTQCDSCLNEIYDTSKVWVCEVCPLRFMGNCCYTALREGTMDCKSCDPAHRLHLVWPLAGDRRADGDGDGDGSGEAKANEDGNADEVAKATDNSKTDGNERIDGENNTHETTTTALDPNAGSITKLDRSDNTTTDLTANPEQTEKSERDTILQDIVIRWIDEEDLVVVRRSWFEELLREWDV